MGDAIAAPELSITYRNVGDLVPYAGNARTHSPKQVEKLAASIREYGFTNPVLMDQDGIIAGHGRVKAALSLGDMLATCRGVRIVDGVCQVPTVTLSGLTPAQRRAYVLADNQLALNAGWDRELLAGEMRALSTFDGLDLGTLGFGDDEMDKMLGIARTKTRRNPDVVPPAPAVPITQAGDIWQLGPHRVACGDATGAEFVLALRNGSAVDAILTDPPYCSGGFQEAGRSAGSVGRRGAPKQVANDRLSTRGFGALLKGAFQHVDASFIYCFTDWRMWVHLFDVVESSGYGVRSMIVWDKGQPGMGRGWRSQHELIMFGAKSVPPFDKHEASAGNVIQAKRTGNVNHTTEKPVDLVAQILKATPFANIVADPFMGSGTTLMACEQVGRVCLGSEIDPHYVDVVVRRWQDFTGKAAVHVASGMTYAQRGGASGN